MIVGNRKRRDVKALPLADRHYNRQKIGSPRFVPPGRCCVLLAGDPAYALWVTSWPFAEYTKHAWAGAWVCSCFRREGGAQASEMIRDAIAATRAALGDPPPLGMVTFLDRRRGKPMFGRTYLLAGFEPCGETKGGLLAFRIAPDAMPAALPAMWTQESLFT